MTNVCVKKYALYEKREVQNNANVVLNYYADRSFFIIVK